MLTGTGLSAMLRWCANMHFSQLFMVSVSNVGLVIVTHVSMIAGCDIHSATHATPTHRTCYPVRHGSMGVSVSYDPNKTLKELKRDKRWIQVIFTQGDLRPLTAKCMAYAFTPGVTNAFHSVCRSICEKFLS